MSARSEATALPLIADVLLEFEILGLAQPAGSKRAFRHPHTGRPILTDANPKSKPWQAEVRAAAAEATRDAVRIRMDVKRSMDDSPAVEVSAVGNM